MTSKRPKFDTEPCMKCGHPKGRHDPVCWASGLIEPHCSKRCMEFKRDNLKWLEGESKKHDNASKVQRLRA